MQLDEQRGGGLVEQAIGIFGITEDFHEAGYILDDGRMLDFSGKNEGGTPGMRALDHRDICRVDIEHGGTAGMHDFMMATNAIRFSMYGRGRDASVNINLVAEPTNAQYKKLSQAMRIVDGEVELDLDKGVGVYDEFLHEYVKGYSLFEAHSYHRGTYVGQILRDIRDYYGESGE